MPAQPESYTIASGEVLSGGRFRLPAWVPPRNSVADISVNTALAVKGVNTEISSITNSWSGAAWAPWVGKYGRMYAAGGGHGDGDQNFIVGYDVEERLFFIEKDKAPVFTFENYIADPVTGWMWANSDGTEVQVGEVFTTHFYCFHIALPPDSGVDDASVAPDGWLYTAGRGTMPAGGQRGTKAAHAYAIGNPDKKFTIHGDPVVFGPTHGPSIYDSRRKRVVSIRESESSATKIHPYTDLETGATGTLSLSRFIMAYYAIGAYWEAEDCYITAVYESGAFKFNIVDAATSIAYIISIEGAAPNEVSIGSFEWVEAWRAWVYYPGNGNNVYTLKCVGDPRSDAFVWGVQTITGTATPSSFGSGATIPLNRFRYCEPLDLFLWFPNHSLPMQAIRIAAP